MSQCICWYAKVLGFQPCRLLVSACERGPLTDTHSYTSSHYHTHTLSHRPPPRTHSYTHSHTLTHCPGPVTRGKMGASQSTVCVLYKEDSRALSSIYSITVNLSSCQGFSMILKSICPQTGLRSKANYGPNLNRGPRPCLLLLSQNWTNTHHPGREIRDQNYKYVFLFTFQYHKTSTVY